MSGLEGGQKSFSRNVGFISLSHACVFLLVWDGHWTSNISNPTPNISWEGLLAPLKPRHQSVGLLFMVYSRGESLQEKPPKSWPAKAQPRGCMGLYLPRCGACRSGCCTKEAPSNCEGSRQPYWMILFFTHCYDFFDFRNIKIMDFLCIVFNIFWRINLPANFVPTL